jgi:dihydrofolate synthase/folylpolyglutamate synthase
MAALDGHVNLEAMVLGRIGPPTLDRARALMDFMGEPQRAYPVIHLTGTNGKGSTARMVTALLIARGLSVGTYTSPDLEGVTERITWNDRPISEPDLAGVLEAVIGLEEMMDDRPTRFELLTAAAYRWFADLAVDAAVVEVGLGGRWDATNVADGDVAVVTNVSLDHAEILGPTLADIAWEKAGIVKESSTLVLGEDGPDLAPIFRRAGALRVWERGQDFRCVENRVAHGGRLLHLRTPGASYPEVYLPVHGSHQGENAAAALAAVEAFFDQPLAGEVVDEAFAGLRLPGRMEVVSHSPLLILDGAHNPAGAQAAVRTLAEEFGAPGPSVLVVGMLKGRHPMEMLSAFAVEEARLVVTCPPPSPRALPADQVAEAASSFGVEAIAASSVEEALDRALKASVQSDVVMVAGSLYVVGAARKALRPSSA